MTTTQKSKSASPDKTSYQPREKLSGEKRFSVPGAKVRIQILDKALVGAVRSAFEGSLTDDGPRGGADFAIYYMTVAGVGKRHSPLAAELGLALLNEWIARTKDALEKNIGRKEALMKANSIDVATESKASPITLSVHTPYARKVVEIFNLMNVAYERTYQLWNEAILTDEQFLEEKRVIIRQCHNVASAISRIFKKAKADAESKGTVADKTEAQERIEELADAA